VDVLVLQHAAVSVVHYKQFMRQCGSSNVAVPVDICVDLGLGFQVTLLMHFSNCSLEGERA
jgi:hypothetical protein